MNQPEVMAIMAAAYLMGCAVALALSFRDYANALQVAVYTGTLLGFYAFFGGEAHTYRWIWYILNARADFFIVLTAGLIQARSSRCVLWFGMVALATDLIYAGFSASGHKLAGIGYFYISNIILALQVAAMLIMSGGFIWTAKKAGSGLSRVFTGKREKPWTQQRYSHS